MNWLNALAGRLTFNQPLSRLSTFRIGGPAKIFFQPKDTEDLKRLLINAKKSNMRIFVIGSGSNLLISDRGIRGIIIKLDSPAFKNISYSRGLLEVGAGLLLSRIISFSLDYNLSGCEFLAGIPGTVGGALVMNAGISERNNNREPKTRAICDLVRQVTVMDYNGNIKLFKKKDIRFDYRTCSLYNYIVLNVTLRLHKKNRKEVRKKLNSYLEFRKKSQDYSHPSAGCIFKNPKGFSAGKLIDMCGLKGRRIGDASISSKHANFIINRGKAKANDVLRLIGYIKRKVKDKFCIELEPEIKIWQN